MYNLRETAQKFKTEQNLHVFEDEDLSSRTSFKIGGKAKLLVEVEKVQDIIFVIQTALENTVPYVVLGGGTNVLFSDSGFDGIVIALNRFRGISLQADDKTNSAVITCLAGTVMNSVVNYCTEESFTALEPFAGLPGTVGGAAYMNARCFDKEISNVVGKISYLEISERASVTTYDAPTSRAFDACDARSFLIQEKTIDYDSALWGYKKSPFTGTNRIITKVEFNVHKGNKSEIESECAKIVKQRVDKGHFKFPCAGSVFKNDRAFGKPSGVIIDEAGLKGMKIGGAEVAPWHGNIIINTNNASAKDVMELVEKIKTVVKEKVGFELETEIIFFGKY